MKNHSIVAVLFYLCTVVNELKGMDNNNHIVLIKSLKEEKKELLHDMRLCNGINIGISIFGICTGSSGIIGALFNDRVLELAGVIGSTVSTALLITTNCMQCCQNPIPNEYDGDYGDL